MSILNIRNFKITFSVQDITIKEVKQNETIP